MDDVFDPFETAGRLGVERKKIVVPAGMMQAALKAAGPDTPNYIRANVVLEAALEWLSEHPIVPTDEQVEAMREGYNNSPCEMFARFTPGEWQRRMFLAPPAEILPLGDLLWDNNGYAAGHVMTRHREEILEAYRRGKESR